MPFTPIPVEKEYEKDKNLTREDIKALADWVKSQPHLPEVTELQLILFLQSCYYRKEAAQNAIENFFTMRTSCPENFSCPTEEELKNELSVATIDILPKPTPEGYTVMFLKLIDTKPENYRSQAQINTVDLIMMLEMMQNGTKNGVYALFDLQGLSFGHLYRFNLSAIKKYIYYIQEAVPVRVKGIHFINIVFFMDKLMALIKPLMKKELVDLLYFHNSMESLYKYIPQECLPEDYGGQAPSVEKLHEKNVANLLANMDLFRWQDTQKVDESKRPEKVKKAKGYAIITSSFKRLEVD